MIAKNIKKIFADILNLEEDDIDLNMELTHENGIEKIHIAKLIIECEKYFKIAIHDEKVHTFLTLKELIKYIKNNLEENRGNISESSEEDRTGWHYI